MKKILFINATTRKNSRTKELCDHLLGKLSGEITRVDLYSTALAPLDADGIEKRNLAAASGDFSGEEFRLARQFADADEIVIAAPYWDLMFPAALKLYFEAVTVVGLTFKYGDHGIPAGLCKARKLYYVTTAGGYIGDLSFGFPYVKAIAQGFYGIGDAVCFSADGLDVFGNDSEKILTDAKKNIDNYF